MREQLSYPERPADYVRSHSPTVTVEYWWREMVVANRKTKVINGIVVSNSSIVEVVDVSYNHPHPPEAYHAYEKWVMSHVLGE